MSENIKTMMEGLGENEFILPVGYKDSDGVVHRTVTLIPMTGETEEAIADPKVRDNGGKIITSLLESVVEKVGTLPRVTKDIIRDLTTIDRDFLLIKNRQVSLGDNISYIDNCPHCRAKNEINVNLANIEPKYLEDEEDRELTFDLPIGYRDASGTVHKEITITLPTGRVQERVAQMVRANPAQATTVMLQLITLKLGTLEFINPDVFKKMTKKDRDFISNKLSELEVGVKFDTEVICSECGSEFVTAIPLQSLLGE
jgi:hypothetical protein